MNLSAEGSDIKRVVCESFSRSRRFKVYRRVTAPPFGYFSITVIERSSGSASEESSSAQRLMAGFSLSCVVLLCAVVAQAKPTIRKERVIRDPELSRQAHEDNKSFQYDHEAFLGKEDAKTFDQLTPEESRDRLG